MSKSHMMIIFAGNIESVRIRELRRVAVGRRENRHHSFTLANECPANFHVFFGRTSRELHRAVVAQEFLNRTRNEVWLRLQKLPLLRVTKEGKETVTYQVDRRLMTGRKK